MIDTVEKKKPRITLTWMAIAVLCINQIIGIYTDYQTHQSLRDGLNQQAQLLNYHLDEQNEDLKESIQILQDFQEYLDRALQRLGVDYK